MPAFIRAACLAGVLSAPIEAFAQRGPWFEVGGGIARQSHTIPGLPTWRAAGGVELSPMFAAGLAYDAGANLDLNCKNAYYHNIAAIVDVRPPRVPALGLRFGGGRANGRQVKSGCGDMDESHGSGLSARYGLGLQLPHFTTLSAVLWADWFVTLNGRHTTISTLGQSSRPYDLRVFQLTLGLRIGDRPKPASR
jgi:hypothetical protein